MPETTPLIKAALNLRGGAGFDVYDRKKSSPFTSGLSSQGIVCELPPIDSEYTGEVHAIISNVGNREYEIKMGDKVGQLVIMPVLIPDFTFENWKERGTGAFGSTGR